MTRSHKELLARLEKAFSSSDKKKVVYRRDDHTVEFLADIVLPDLEERARTDPDLDIIDPTETYHDRT